MAVANFTTAAATDDPLVIDAGKRLADLWCSSCHVTGASSQQSALPGATPFPDLADDPAFGEGDLAISLYNPHPAMPSIDVGREDIKALAAYIRSLNPSHETRRETEARGRDLATALCADCHAIAGAGPSPEPEAPVFSTFALRWPIEALAEALAEGIVVGHDEVDMPEFVFGPSDINDLLGFIESVQLSE